MPRYTLEIDGMHCSGCEERVEDGLGKVEGVRSAEADHEAGEARVRVVAGEEDEDALREAVEGLGYDVVDAETA